MKKIKEIILLVFFTIHGIIFSQTQSQKNKITSQYDKNELGILMNKFLDKEIIDKNEAIKIAKIKNWPLIIKKNGNYAELIKVLNNNPIYYTTSNVSAAISTRTNHLNSNGSLGLELDGQNMIVNIWDGGLARTTHQEYDGIGGNNRFSIGDNTTFTHYHSAHVTGTIIASGVIANSKGMAPQARAVGYDWNYDKSEATDAASNGMLISNHSYGYNPISLPDYYFGGYIPESRDWDEIMFNAPYYLMVVAAGNDGYNNSYNGTPLEGNPSYDKLTGHSTSKNNLVIANAQDADIDTNGDLVSVTINGSSSQGPTDDYRIKPDITGNGTSLYSTYSNSDNAYNYLTGTSMASPNVAGTLILLQQHANNVNGFFIRAATLKGLVLHTADDIMDNGPDAISGWGLLNAKRAAETITNNGNETMIEELTLSNGETYQITVNADSTTNLKASISWTDRPGESSTNVNSNEAVLVNDLDIRVNKNGVTYYPWKLTSVSTNTKGDNIKDPFERVDITGTEGTYTITVSHKGTLIGNTQNYTLIITGMKSCADNLLITQNVNTGATDIQESSNTITATNTIFPNGIVAYDAGTTVYLKPNFHAKHGSHFRAFIEGCQPTLSKLSKGAKQSLSDKEVTSKNEDIEFIKLYPNPTKGILTIESTKEVNYWMITDAYGKSYYRGNHTKSEINMSNLPKGIYFLKAILNNGKVAMKKVVRN